MDVNVKKPSALTYEEAQAWRAFQQADPALHSPYYTLEFALACDRVRADTQVAVLRIGGAIKGFFPFHRAPLGYALPLGGPLGDFQGLIAEPGMTFEINAILQAAGISVYPFSFIPATQSSFATRFEAQEDCHTADLSKGYEHWYTIQLAAHKKTFKKYEANARRLEREHGELVFTMHDPDPAAFTTLLAWKSAQYRATGFFDVFSVPWTGNLLRAIAEAKSKYLVGQLSTLRAGNTLVAVHFGMKSAQAAHYWFPAYDPQFSRFGPGHTLMFKMLENHAASGIGQMHLGVGDYRYKREFGGHMVPVCSGTALAPSFGAVLRQSAQAIQRGFEALPLGPISRLPGRALRRFDRTMAFHPA
ncbi:MAG: GNAT family N-acetyltransferase [Robiginitomaculum sp.]|nr:GNAT family N-acetyltransferase [Robiginitomaculum sp.]MDQ7078306.1 GNAT family N-acetyltransferase [Robiginitomaculum sp.]